MQHPTKQQRFTQSRVTKHMSDYELGRQELKKDRGWSAFIFILCLLGLSYQTEASYLFFIILMWNFFR